MAVVYASPTPQPVYYTHLVVKHVFVKEHSTALYKYLIAKIHPYKAVDM
jgi:hypothetical protein